MTVSTDWREKTSCIKIRVKKNKKQCLKFMHNAASTKNICPVSSYFVMLHCDPIFSKSSKRLKFIGENLPTLCFSLTYFNKNSYEHLSLSALL